MNKIASLYNHWCVADSIKQFVTATVPVKNGEELPEELMEMGQLHSSFMRLSVWYALLRVVIEGYQNLKLQDEGIDHFLRAGEYVEALRRFRNAMFHYQTDPFSDKLMTFLELDEATKWARGLNKAFEKFFESALQIQKMYDLMKSSGQPGAQVDDPSPSGYEF
jgi:hypothetical protein